MNTFLTLAYLSMKEEIQSEGTVQDNVRNVTKRDAQGVGIIGLAGATWHRGLRVGTTDALRGPTYSIAFTPRHMADASFKDVPEIFEVSGVTYGTYDASIDGSPKVDLGESLTARTESLCECSCA